MIEEIAPHELAESWDNPGLQVGALDQKIKIIFFSLDPTIQSLQSAIKYKADLLLTHHPLIFRPISKIDFSFYPGDVVNGAIKNGISIVSAHTNLDSAPGGLNDILAEMLDLKEVEVLKKNEVMNEAGLGRIGRLDENIRLRDLLEHIKRIFDLKNIRVVSDTLEKQINKIAVVSGSGGSLITFAAQKGADVLITGDISYHDALNALSYGLILIDAGHFYTENVAFKKFSEKFKNILENKGFDAEIIFDNNKYDPFYIA